MATLNNYTVYGLASSENGELIRYVGITTKKLNVRLNEHRNYCKKNFNKRGNWIGKVIRGGNKLVLVILESELTREEAIVKERHYIKLFKSFGADLVNGTSGGDGVRDYTPTAEARERMRQAKLGSAGYWAGKKRGKIPGFGGGIKGRPRSEETKKKLSVAHTGKIIPQEQRDKMSIARTEYLNSR